MDDIREIIFIDLVILWQFNQSGPDSTGTQLPMQ